MHYRWWGLFVCVASHPRTTSSYHVGQLDSRTYGRYRQMVDPKWRCIARTNFSPWGRKQRSFSIWTRWKNRSSVRWCRYGLPYVDSVSYFKLDSRRGIVEAKTVIWTGVSSCQAKMLHFDLTENPKTIHFVNVLLKTKIISLAKKGDI